MNASEMLDLAFGQLEGVAREQAERALATDADLSLRFDRLSESIHQLLDDGQEIEVPEGLARRTVTFALEKRNAPSRRRILDFVPVTVPFRWADLAVAAGIFLAGLLTLLPAMQRSRDRMNQAGCGYNLQQLGRALWQYGSRHDVYPFTSPQEPNGHAGSFAVMLHDAGLIHDRSTLTCPCRKHPGLEGKAALPLPTSELLAKVRRSDPDYYRKLIAWDYAYNVGYRHESGVIVPIPAKLSATIPLLADQPPHQNYERVLEGNSPNHGGHGQNVLYSDLHVGWHNTRRLGPNDDDMYLNAEKQLAPGVNIHDAALLPSLVPCGGW